MAIWLALEKTHNLEVIKTYTNGGGTGILTP